MGSCYITQGARASICSNLEGWDGVEVGRRFQREGTYVYLWLIHIVVCKK